MMTAPHMVTGAAIGRMKAGWWIVLPFAFASHFVLDYIPHTEASVFFSDRLAWSTYLVGALSICLGIGLVVWVSRRQRNWKMMLAVSMVAMLPDLADRTFGWDRMREWPATSGFFHFHHTFHHSLQDSQWPLGLSTQIIVLAVALWMARRNG